MFKQLLKRLKPFTYEKWLSQLRKDDSIRFDTSFVYNDKLIFFEIFPVECEYIYIMGKTNDLLEFSLSLNKFNRNLLNKKAAANYFKFKNKIV